MVDGREPRHKATEPEWMLSSWADFLADEPMKPRDAATSPSL